MNKTFKIRNSKTGEWYSKETRTFSEECMVKSPELDSRQAAVVNASFANTQAVDSIRCGSMFCGCDECEEIDNTL